jgi:hypothetical protein
MAISESGMPARLRSPSAKVLIGALVTDFEFYRTELGSGALATNLA